MKKWADYIDSKGLIIGLNNSLDVGFKEQLGDTLQRCGMWFLFSYFYFKNKPQEAVDYLHENFGVLNGWEKRDNITPLNAICFRFYKMYQTCYHNELTKLKERYPIRHPTYEVRGNGKTSRDQMMSNLWSLLIIATSDSLSTERQRWAHIELYNLWDKLKKDFFILPAKDLLGPEHLSVFWRLFYINGDNIEKAIYAPLIWLGDLHNYLSTLIKIRHAKKYRYHVDDVNRICMLMGSNLVKPTFWSKLSLNTYLKKRPAYVPVGSYYHNKPNSEFEYMPELFGPTYAMRYYCEYQEAPWDEFFNRFSGYLGFLGFGK